MITKVIPPETPVKALRTTPDFLAGLSFSVYLETYNTETVTGYTGLTTKKETSGTTVRTLFLVYCISLILFV